MSQKIFNISKDLLLRREGGVTLQHCHWVKGTQSD